MIGLLVIIAVSWVLLFFIEKKHIIVLGVIPNLKRTSEFLIGVLVIFIILGINIFFSTLWKNMQWQLNDHISIQNIFNSFVYHIRSALTEDLVFRGAILYILIQRIGAKKALWISAMIFGVYHIFSYGIGNGPIVPMVYVTLITGLTGYVWAYTFYKTKSVLMGLGFHLGFNFFMSLIYEGQPYGELIFTCTSMNEIGEWNQLFFALFNGLFPTLLTFLFVKMYLKQTQNSKDEN